MPFATNRPSSTNTPRKLVQNILSLLAVNTPETQRWWPKRAYTQTQADKIIKIIPLVTSICISIVTPQGTNF